MVFGVAAGEAEEEDGQVVVTAGEAVAEEVLVVAARQAAGNMEKTQ